MKKMTLTLCFAILLSGLVGCGQVDENAENITHPEEETDRPANMDQVSQQTDKRDDYTVDDRVKRDEREEGSRNETDGRGTFWFNNPQDVTDKDTFTEEEREAEEERAERYEWENGQQESIEQVVDTMDDVEESYVVVDDTRVIVGIKTNGNDVDQTIAAVEERLRGQIDEKELIVTDDENRFEQMREDRSQ